jgi:hypothetical protein
MSQISHWLPSRRQLQQHLARLVDTLEALVQRLRESIARTVGEAVANAVHEVTHRLSRLPRHAPARPSWQEREPSGWDDPRYPDWDEEPDRESARYRDDESDSRTPPEAPASRWHRAAAVGCQTAAWWLGRQVGRRPLWAATTLGVSAALLSYAAGPVIGVGLAGIAGAALHLLGLTEAVASSATALGR